MLILEQIQKLNNMFDDFERRFHQIDKERQAQMERYASNLKELRAKKEKEKNELLSLKENVLTYYRIAKANTSQELQTGGITGERPDIPYLNSLIYQINDDSMEDSTARTVVLKASRYVVWLDAKLRRIDARKLPEESAGMKQTEENRKLDEKKQQLIQEYVEMLQGPGMKKLLETLDILYNDYAINERFFTEFGKTNRRRNKILFGYQELGIRVPDYLCGILKERMGSYFNEHRKSIHYPVGFQTDKCKGIYIRYTYQNADKIKDGIQAVILNILRYSGGRDYKISVFDLIHYNAELLGRLYSLSKIRNGIVERVPGGEEEYQKAVRGLAAYYHGLEEQIGAESVWQYNARQKDEKDKIAGRILIINREYDAYTHKDSPEMLYLMNNAQKLGMICICAEKCANTDGCLRHEDKMNELSGVSIAIKSDERGRFYIRKKDGWNRFSFLTPTKSIPQSFIEYMSAVTGREEIGTHYSKRYSLRMPARSSEKRKEIIIPFAVDENDQPVSAAFVNENFAAYIMGAAGSGKSTLLHTMIAGLVMNYHPDELELWLMDFKMVEFRRYIDLKVPHIKYILLEKSEDMVFDILDRLTEVLEKRQYIFARNGWDKLSDVPVGIYMPAIFVMIDEFAQMSQVIRAGSDYGKETDYRLKLENLLTKGRALGFKFIFSSQTYTTGVSGLTDTACKQIQMRFAMKNTQEEIKHTLEIKSNQIPQKLEQDIISLSVFETLFKSGSGNEILHLRNLYLKKPEIDSLMKKLGSFMLPAERVLETGADRLYFYKHPVYIDGGEPVTFISQLKSYQEYEKRTNTDECDLDDIFLFPGAPCSFQTVYPLVLRNAVVQNILLAGGNRENLINVIWSLKKSYARTGRPVEIWAHDQNALYRKCRDTVFAKERILTETEEICRRFSVLREKMTRREAEQCLIMVLGYEELLNDIEILGSIEISAEKREMEQPEKDLAAVLAEIEEMEEPEKGKERMEEYNAEVQGGTG